MPGVVFRVSKTFTFVPSISLFISCVFVAIPLMRCIQFSTSLSAVSKEIEGPSIVKAISPILIASPSFKILFITMRSSTFWKIRLAKATPAKIPFSFTKSCVFPIASLGIQANEV